MDKTQVYEYMNKTWKIYDEKLYSTKKEQN